MSVRINIFLIYKKYFVLVKNKLIAFLVYKQGYLRNMLKRNLVKPVGHRYVIKVVL